MTKIKHRHPPRMWPNRDPIGEQGFEVLRFRSSDILQIIGILERMGGNNVYLFDRNQPTYGYDPLGLAPQTGPGTIACESATEQAEAALAAWRANESEPNRQALLAAVAKMAAACKAPEKPPQPPQSDKSACKQVCGWALVGTILYWICSEGSRLFPPRNLVPVP